MRQSGMTPTVSLLVVQAVCAARLARLAECLLLACPDQGGIAALHRVRCAFTDLHGATTALLNSGHRADDVWQRKADVVIAEMRGHAE